MTASIKATDGVSEGSSPLLRLVGVTLAFGGVRALDDASLEVAPGEVHTLLGENGAGKSTLVKVMAGVLRPDAGRVFWENVELDRLDVSVARRLGIRIIYQRLSTVAHLSVAENLALGREPTRFGIILRQRERRDAAAALERLGVSLHLDRQAGTLSVAERQLIEIGRALQGHLRVLVMDEPTASLGEREVERLFDVIRSLRTSGIAVIFISHKLAEVMTISDRVTVLRDGRTIDTVSARATSSSRLVEMMVGRAIAQGFQEERGSPGTEVVLEARDLWTESVLRGVSFALYRGEILGVYGLMGSGRTELARALFGADRLAAGQVLVDGRIVAPGSPAEAKHLGMGLVPEERPQSVFDELSVRENISSASGDLIAPAGIIRGGKERRLASRIVDSLGVRTTTIEAPLRSLSGGNQQKVVLGKWLMREARILIMDDPTAGVDVGAKLEIYRLIRRQTRDGASVLMSSSELPELLAIANRILVLHQGRSVGILSGEAMTQRNVLHLAVRGVAAGGTEA